MNSEVYLLGVDIGTQGAKAALYSSDGKQIATAFETSNLISHEAGSVEQDPEEMFLSVLHTIKNIMDTSKIDPSKVAAIGLDGQMAGILGIDDDFNAVTYYDSWLDSRCGKYIDIIKQKAEDRVIQLTGCPVTYAHGPKILWWKNEKPDIYEKIVKFVVPTTYVVGRLTGINSNEAYIDYTHIHFSGFADTENLCWSCELLDLFEIDIDKMPEIVEPSRIIGKITQVYANLCGLVPGIPVIAGSGDQAATSLGAGITQEGMVFDVSGTASVFSCCAGEYNPDIKNKTIVYPRSIINGLWIPLAYISGGGLCLKWFRDNVLSDSATFAELDMEASRIQPGSGNLVFIPHFGGRTCPNDKNVKGTWIGLGWIHNRGHLYRSIMESIAYEYGFYLKILKNLSSEMDFTKVVTIGGGSKSTVFNSIKADVLNISYSTLEISETATLGSAVTAGYGVGLYEDLPDIINKIVKTNENVIVPNKQNHDSYKKYVSLYENLFPSLKSAFQCFDDSLGVKLDLDGEK